MNLKKFLGSARNIKKVKITNSYDEANIIYEGSYIELLYNIGELRLNNALVMFWYVEGDIVFIGIYQ